MMHHDDDHDDDDDLSHFKEHAQPLGRFGAGRTQQEL